VVNAVAAAACTSSYSCYDDQLNLDKGGFLVMQYSAAVFPVILAAMDNKLI